MLQLVLLAAPAAAAILIGHLRPRAAAASATVAAAATTVILIAWWSSGAPVLIDQPWLPSIGSRLKLGLDALGAPIAVFASGVAVPVLWYSAGYLPHHLKEERRDPDEVARFTALVLAFMLSMVVLVLAQDLVVMFLALELTAVASFLLIRFDERKPEARRAALLALVVTAGSSLLFLTGALLIAGRNGSALLSELRSGTAEVTPIAVACLVLGVVAKSAQVPLHFWLPRAMIAPTPVSAYLHSAALVAAGVFVLQRLRFLLELAPGATDALFWLDFLSIGVGGVFAFTADEFKRILAYSTIAQFGYAVVLVAEGGAHGAFGAPFFLIAHGVAKCALFMTAGAVTAATGQHRLSESGGLARRMPLLAAASGLAAAGLAGLPLTIGYFKDDLLIKAALERGDLAAALAAAAIALTLAYTVRFWFGIFGGERRPGTTPGVSLTLPVAALGLLVLVGGLWTGPIEAAFTEAGRWIIREPVDVQLAYKASPSPAVLLTLAAWGVGAALAVSSRWSSPLVGEPLARLAGSIGPAALSDRLAATGTALSDRLHALEVRDLRDRLTVVVIPAAALVVLGLLSYRQWPSVGALRAEDLTLAGALLLAAGSALAAAGSRRHLTFVLLMSFTGFSLSIAFALAFAPDVALVLVLVDTALTLLFLTVLSRIQPAVMDDTRERAVGDQGPLTGIAAGIVGTAAAWIALSSPKGKPPAIKHVELADEAHAKDVVTAILTDFRGLDTAGELTVLVVAIFGAAAITWGRRI